MARLARTFRCISSQSRRPVNLDPYQCWPLVSCLDCRLFSVQPNDRCAVCAARMYPNV